MEALSLSDGRGRLDNPVIEKRNPQLQANGHAGGIAISQQAISYEGVEFED